MGPISSHWWIRSLPLISLKMKGRGQWRLRILKNPCYSAKRGGNTKMYIYNYIYILLTALLRLTFAVYGRSIVRPDFGQCGRESWARRIHVCLWTWSSQSSEPDRPLFIQGGTTVSILAGKSSAKTTTLIPLAWWASKNFNFRWSVQWFLHTDLHADAPPETAVSQSESGNH